MRIYEHILCQYYGEREIEGAPSNQIILEIIKKYTPWIDNDGDIAWCAMFMTHVLDELGYDLPKPILAAREFLKIGKPVDIPTLGDLVVYSRGNPSGWKGHVGIYVRRIGDTVFTLGGNQGNAITISAYSSSRLLGYRRLS